MRDAMASASSRLSSTSKYFIRLIYLKFDVTGLCQVNVLYSGKWP
jgi:hypothetical protein